MSSRSTSFARALRAPLTASVLFVALAGASSAQCPETSVPSPGGPHAGAEFGTSVAVAGDVAVIGAPGWAPAGGPPEGAAMVSTWTGSAWVSSQLPRPATLAPGSRFGQDVAINEDASIIAVGAPLHDGPAVDGGKLVIYEWNPGLAKWLITFDGDGIFGSGLYGWSVAASGDLVAVGEPGGAFALGTVNVYRRTAPGSWTNDGLLFGVEPFALFGADVALSGEVLAVGAPLDDDPLVDEGSVDVYARVGSTWTLREHLADWIDQPGSLFGWSVDVDMGGDLLAIGMPGSIPNTPGGLGRVYHWVNGAYSNYLAHWDNDGPPCRLGQSMAISEDRVAMGMPGYDVGGLGLDTGRTDVFQRNPWGTWELDDVLLAGSAPEAGAQFGFANALSGRRLLVGKPFADPGGLASAGLVTAYDLGPSILHTDLGYGLAGSGGVTPQMKGDGGLCDWMKEWVIVEGALAGAPIYIVAGIGMDPLPFKGGVLVPKPDLIVSLGAVYPTGTTGFYWEIPPGLPAFNVWMQAWIKDPGGVKGFSATNALRTDYPAS